MREKYWAMYEQIKYSERYYFFYRESSKCIDTVIKVFLVIISLSSIANLSFWGKAPLLWAIVAAVAQVVSAVMYLFPFSDQVTVLNYLLPELDHLLNHIDHDWDRINILMELSDDEINDLVLKYNEQYSDMENRHIGSTHLPRRKRCDKKAVKDCETWKFSRFNITQTDYLKEALKDAHK